MNLGTAAAYLGGGLLSGAGAGLVDDGATKRAVMLKQLDQEFSEKQTDKQIAATAEQHGLDREHSTDIQTQNQAFQAGQAPPTADQNGLYWTRDTQGKAQPLMGADGKQMSQRLFNVDPETGKPLAEDDPKGSKMTEAGMISLQGQHAAQSRTDAIVAGRVQTNANTNATKLQLADLSDATKRLAIDAANGNKEAERTLKEKLGGDHDATQKAIADANNLSKDERNRLTNETRVTVGAGHDQAKADLAGKNSKFSFAYNAYLEANPGDNKGALEFASGKRTISDVQINKWASDAADKQMANDPAAFSLKGDAYAKERQKKFDAALATLKGSKGDAAAPSSAPSPTPPVTAPVAPAIPVAKAPTPAAPDASAAPIPLPGDKTKWQIGTTYANPDTGKAATYLGNDQWRLVSPAGQ